MSEWKEMELGDFVELKRGYDLPKKKREPGGIPLISSSGESDFHSEAKVKGPGVITGRYGTIGEVFYVEDDFWPLNTTLYVKDFKGNDPLFVYYFLKTISYSDYSDKAAVPGINRNHLHKALINVPVDPVCQRELAEKLWALDSKIKLNRQTNQTLEQIAQAIFKSWFVDFEPTRAKIIVSEKGGTPLAQELAAQAVIAGQITLEKLSELEPGYQGLEAQLHPLVIEGFGPVGPDYWQPEKLQEIAASFPNAIEDSELGEIPEGWCLKKVGECVERFSVGKKFTQKTSNQSGAIPVLDQGKSGIIGYHDEEPGVRASPDDPIIVFANHTCYMRVIMHDFSAIQNVLPFKGANLNIFWIYEATYGKQEFIEYKGHWPDLSVKEIVVPVNELDVHYGDLVNPIHVARNQNEKENQVLCDLRDILLPKLLVGELTLTEYEKPMEVTL